MILVMYENGGGQDVKISGYKVKLETEKVEK